jgi:hypothetical protein
MLISYNLTPTEESCCNKPDLFEKLRREYLSLLMKTNLKNTIKSIKQNQIGNENTSLLIYKKDLILNFFVLYLILLHKERTCANKPYNEYISDTDIAKYKKYFYCLNIDIDCFIRLFKTNYNPNEPLL